jgi:cell division protein FtsA
MKLFPFFGQKEKPKEKKEEKFLISLDIGTEVLKGLLFSMNDMGVDVWYSYQVKQQTHAMRSGVILNEETVLENARLVVQKLSDAVDPEDRPKRMVLGMAGELINGITINVQYDRGRQAGKRITDQESQLIINSVISDILENGKAELAKRLGETEDQVEVLQITVTGLGADGISVPELEGTAPHDVQLNLYASFAPKAYIDTLRKLSQELGLGIASIVTQPFAVSRAFLGNDDPNFSGIFIDIGGGTTDVALVQNGNNIQTKMFAFGGRAFTKRISQSMETSFNVAEGRKIKYSLGELPLDMRDEVRRSLSSDVSLWVEALEVALEDLENVKQYPGQFYMCGGGAMLPDLKEAILAYAWYKRLPFKRIPKVQLVTPDKLDRVYDKSGLLVNPYDVTPASLARFYWEVLRKPHFNYLGDY